MLHIVLVLSPAGILFQSDHVVDRRDVDWNPIDRLHQRPFERSFEIEAVLQHDVYSGKTGLTSGQSESNKMLFIDP